MTLLLNHTFTQTRRTLQTLFGLSVVALLTVACTAGPTPPSSGLAPVANESEATVAEPAAESATPTTVAAEPPTPEPTAAAVVLIPTATPVQEEVIPTSAPEAPSDWVNTATVDGDYFILGNPNAPVRLVDYSDFL